MPIFSCIYIYTYKNIFAYIYNIYYIHLCIYNIHVCIHISIDMYINVLRTIWRWSTSIVLAHLLNVKTKLLRSRNTRYLGPVSPHPYVSKKESMIWVNGLLGSHTEKTSKVFHTSSTHRIHVWYIYLHLPSFTIKINQM